MSKCKEVENAPGAFAAFVREEGWHILRSVDRTISLKQAYHHPRCHNIWSKMTPEERAPFVKIAPDDDNETEPGGIFYYDLDKFSPPSKQVLIANRNKMTLTHQNRFYTHAMIAAATVGPGWSFKPGFEGISLNQSRFHEVPELLFFRLTKSQEDFCRDESIIQYLCDVFEVDTEAGPNLEIEGIIKMEFRVAFVEMYDFKVKIGAHESHVPSEIGVISFTLKDGITNVWHKHIKFKSQPDENFELDERAKRKLVEDSKLNSRCGINPLDNSGEHQDFWELENDYEILWSQLYHLFSREKEPGIFVPREQHNKLLEALHWIYYQAFERYLETDFERFIPNQSKVRFFTEQLDIEMREIGLPWWANGRLVESLHYMGPHRLMPLEDLLIVYANISGVKEYEDCRHNDNWWILLSSALLTKPMQFLKQYDDVTKDRTTRCAQHLRPQFDTHKCGLAEIKKRLYLLFTVARDWLHYPIDDHLPVPAPCRQPPMYIKEFDWTTLHIKCPVMRRDIVKYIPDLDGLPWAPWPYIGAIPYLRCEVKAGGGPEYVIPDRFPVLQQQLRFEGAVGGVPNKSRRDMAVLLPIFDASRVEEDADDLIDFVEHNIALSGACNDSLDLETHVESPVVRGAQITGSYTASIHQGSLYNSQRRHVVSSPEMSSCSHSNKPCNGNPMKSPMMELPPSLKHSSPTNHHTAAQKAPQEYSNVRRSNRALNYVTNLPDKMEASGSGTKTKQLDIKQLPPSMRQNKEATHRNRRTAPQKVGDNSTLKRNELRYDHVPMYGGREFGNYTHSGTNTTFQMTPQAQTENQCRDGHKSNSVMELPPSMKPASQMKSGTASQRERTRFRGENVNSMAPQAHFSNVHTDVSQLPVDVPEDNLPFFDL